MKHLNQYVPLDEDGRPCGIICHGYQLSHERMAEAGIAMAAAPSGRLEDLIPRPQNFHKINYPTDNIG